MKSNIEIVQEYIEKVCNQKRFDLWDQYFSEDYLGHGSPYVGTGFTIDNSEGKHIVNSIASGGSAEEKLQVGDELIWAEDEKHRFDTFEGLKHAVLMGFRGSSLKLGVRRGDQILDFELTKDLIEGYDFSKETVKTFVREFLLRDYPDVKATIRHIMSQEDMVACFLEWCGTDSDFDREAIWMEAWFMRLSEGKIVEDWYVSDGISQLKQLGYQINAPGT